MNNSFRRSIQSGYRGMAQVETDDQLRKLLDAGVTVHAMGTGPFGEDEGAKVIYFGKVKNIPRKIWNYNQIHIDESEFEDVFDEDYFETSDDTIIILDKNIGQFYCNFYIQDAYTVADRDLYVDNEDWTEVLGVRSSKKIQSAKVARRNNMIKSGKYFVQVNTDDKVLFDTLQEANVSYMQAVSNSTPDDYITIGETDGNRIIQYDSSRGMLKNSRQIKSNYYRIHYDDYRLPVGRIKDSVVIRASDEKSARDKFNKHCHYGATIDKVVECDEFGNDLIKSAYTREDYDRFDENGEYIPYKPTEEELAKKDEIKKVLKQELSEAYEPDPMDDYAGYDTTDARIDMACERVAKQFNVDTDFVEEIAGEIQNEDYARAMAEAEWIYEHCKDKHKFWAWQNGEDVSLEELGIDKEQMDREVDEIVRKSVKSSRAIKSAKKVITYDEKNSRLIAKNGSTVFDYIDISKGSKKLQNWFADMINIYHFQPAVYSGDLKKLGIQSSKVIKSDAELKIYDKDFDRFVLELSDILRDLEYEKNDNLGFYEQGVYRTKRLLSRGYPLDLDEFIEYLKEARDISHLVFLYDKEEYFNSLIKKYQNINSSKIIKSDAESEQKLKEDLIRQGYTEEEATQIVTQRKPEEDQQTSGEESQWGM